MKTNLAEFITEYNALISFISEHVPEYDKEAAEDFFIAAFLKIWASNVLYSPDYGTLIQEITGENYSIEQVMTAMGCCGDPERRLAVPEFFVRMLGDNENDTVGTAAGFMIDNENDTAGTAAGIMIRDNKNDPAGMVSDFIGKVSEVLVAAAMINGDFTEEEAAAASGILRIFTEYASSAGYGRMELPEFNAQITGRNESSYLQNDALLEAARQEKIRPGGRVSLPGNMPASGNIQTSGKLQVSEKFQAPGTMPPPADLHASGNSQATGEQAAPDYPQVYSNSQTTGDLQSSGTMPPPGSYTESSEKHFAQSDNPINITINNLNFGHAGNASSDDAASTDKTFSDVQPELPEEASLVKPGDNENETIESLLEELDGLVGLENVKKDVHSLMNFIKVTKIREQRGMKVPTISYHLVFTGNPGTGKTTVARLVAKLYYHMGILPQGQLVETDRSALVAGYLGQTAIKTQKVIQQAMGGVLFIDEAYSLAGDEQDSYGKEAIETILKAMEDHRDELVVIVAGYTRLMHKFIESNPGLSSRFSKYFEYPDYTGQELMDIFCRFCEKNGYTPDPEAASVLQRDFEQMYENRDEHFGNARSVRNIFEKAINAQADRIAGLPDITDADLQNITAADIIAAVGGDMA